MSELIIGSLYKKLHILKTISIIDIVELSTWRLLRDNNSYEIVELPLRIVKPDKTARLRRSMLVDPEKGFPLILFDGDFDAILLINNQYYYGIDMYTKKIPLYGIYGEIDLELIVFPQRIVGEKYEKPFINRAYLIYTDRELESFIDRLIWLLDLSKQVEEEEVKQDLVDLVDQILAKIPLQNPDPKHFLIMKYYVNSHLSYYSMLYDELMRLSQTEPGKLREFGYGIINREELRRVITGLRSELIGKLKKLREKYGKRGLLYTIANAHIDAAWLWRAEDTAWKIAKTMAKIITQFKAYDKPVFVFSSALYAEWLKEKYPSLWDEVRKLIHKERIVPVTGMYVESDVYIIPSESLARQFLYGQEIFKKLIGKRSIIGWLPDCFGFSPNLPQIMKESGIKLFITHKVIWNEYNEFPHDTFLWRGIDGTAIPTHIVTGEMAKTADPKSLIELWRKYREKQVAPARMYPYGYCDGGSGPTHEMFDKLDFYGEETPVTPRIIHGGIADFIYIIMNNKDRLPVWYGDIYLETHRGAYTTDTCIKHGVWMLDYLLRTLEQIYTWLFIKGINYPEGEIERLWKTLLLAEFHDILSGTITYEVHEDICGKLAESIDKAKKLINKALKILANDRRGVIVYNPTQWRRREVIDINDVSIEVDVPGHGFKILPLDAVANNRDNEVEESNLTLNDNGDIIIIENSFFVIKISKKGLITSIYDKLAEREILRKPSALIKVYEDLPSEWDAWNIDEQCLKHSEELLANNVYIHRRDRYRVVVRTEYTYRNSNLFMDIIVYENSRRIDFRLETIWKDKWRLVKIWFYPDINSIRSLRDTQFGVYERSSHVNTTWEKARFEEPMLSWCSIEDESYGFAVISPYKHGVSIKFNEIGLSLIKSPVLPNPLSDAGHLIIKFSILPYTSSWSTSKIFVEAKKVRDPLYVFVNNDGTSRYEQIEDSFLEVEPDNIVVETIKKSSNGNNIVVRLYESANKYGLLNIKPKFEISKAWRTNILEDQIRELAVENNEIKYVFRPYELITIMIKQA